jgi:hypothetical protein
MILLDAVVQVGTLPDPDWLQFAPRPILEPVCGIAGQNGFPVRLAAVNHDPLGPAVPLQRSGEEALCGSQIAPLAEPELDRVPVAVDGAIEIHPSPAHLDIRLIDMPVPADGSLASIEPLEKLG